MTVILVFQPRNRTFAAISVNKDVSRQWLQASSVAWWAPRALGKEEYLPVSSQQTIATAYGEPWVTQDVETQDPDPRELRHTAQERCQPARLLNLPIHGKALNSNPLTWIIWFALIYKKTFDIEDMPANTGDPRETEVQSLVRKIPWVGKGNLFQYSSLENHGEEPGGLQSLQPPRESDTAEWLSTHTTYVSVYLYVHFKYVCISISIHTYACVCVCIHT